MWKQWRVVVVCEDAAATALEQLNSGIEAGATEDELLAFPAFRYDKDTRELYSTSQPRGDPLKLAVDFERLTSLSARHPAWRFQLSAMGEQMWTWSGGAITDFETQQKVRRFLDEVRAWQDQPRVDSTRIEIAIQVTAPDSRALLEQRQTELRGKLLGMFEGYAFRVGDEDVPIVTALVAQVSAEQIHVSATLAAKSRRAAVMAFITHTAEVLFSARLPDEFDARVTIGGAELGRAAHAIELRLLGPILSSRVA